MGKVAGKARKVRDTARAKAQKAGAKAKGGIYYPAFPWVTAAKAPAGWQPTAPWEHFGPRDRLVEIDGPDGRVAARWSGRAWSSGEALRKARASQRTGRSGR